ncbi:hypothetical protein A3L09_08365 [Thermococcus profundus]|uniref:DUF86 domain-containing protein n=2 Tax=Thermococcus profundus TaxID=49899 RepID=A0A2Z2MBG6_THEPR|nr:hypothetical protein A3L09_08365 [Thermococcus profundus]
MPSTAEEFENLGLLKDGIYKRLEFSIQLILDTLSAIGRKNGIIAVSYADMIAGLKERGILPEELAEKASFLKDLREILIYDYDLMDDGIAFRNMDEYLEHIESLLNFIRGAVG